MKNIDKYILAYLLTNHKVFLAGIGGFAIEEIPAFYNEEAHTFIPPTIKLYFVQTLRGNNTGFLFFLSHQLNIPFQQAKKDFDSYLLSINQTLKNKGEVSLNILGNLRKINGIIEFIPSSQVKKIERFGLEELPVSSTIQPENVIKKVKYITAPTSTIGKYVAAASLILSFLMYPANKSQNHSEASIIDVNRENVALTSNLPQQEKETLSRMEKVFEIKKNLVPTHKKNVKIFSTKTIHKETIKKEKITETSVTANSIVPKRNNWGVVLGAFKNEHNALKLLKKDALGIDLQIIKVKGLYRVIAGKFLSKKEAKLLQQKLKSQGKSGWVCKY